jgi:hypothetical protein
MGPEILLCVGSALKSFVPANVAMLCRVRGKNEERGELTRGGRGGSVIGMWEGD